MKKLFLFLLLLSGIASAQQLPPYERTRQNQVLSDRATQSKFFLGLPSADAFIIPAYVPDSLKAKGVWIKTGTNRGIYIYNPSTGYLEKVGETPTIDTVTNFNNYLVALNSNGKLTQLGINYNNLTNTLTFNVNTQFSALMTAALSFGTPVYRVALDAGSHFIKDSITYASQVNLNTERTRAIAAEATKGTLTQQNTNTTDIATIKSTTYLKSKVDSLISLITPARFVYNTGTGASASVTSTTIQNVFIQDVFRDGKRFNLITTGSPDGSSVLINTTTGVATFMDKITAYETLVFNYRGIAGNPIVSSTLQLVTVGTYAQMASLLTGTKTFYVLADEVNTDDYGTFGQPATYTFINGVLNKLSGRRAN